MKNNIIGILFLFFCSANSFAQITVNTTLSKAAVQLGEELVLDVSIAFPAGTKIIGVEYSAFDSIESDVPSNLLPDSLLREDIFAEIEWPREDIYPDGIWPNTRFIKNGNVFLKSIAIRIWDVGQFTLPQLRIIQDTSSRQQAIQYLQSPSVNVLPPTDIAVQDTTQAFMPIKSILEEDRTWEDFMWLLFLFLFLITLALVIYMLYFKKKKQEYIEEEIIIRPAHEIGIEKLNDLKSKELWQQGKIKSYQSQLTYIIREYLENRFGIQALESTTEEIMRDLKGKDFDLTNETNLREILQIADLVKFAKAQPGAEIHSKFMNQAYDLVEQTKKVIAEIEETKEDDE